MIGTPGFIFFGWLSDKIGRKIIIMAGCLLAVLTYFYVFPAMLKVRQPGTCCCTSKGNRHRDGRPATCSFGHGPIADEIDFHLL